MGEGVLERLQMSTEEKGVEIYGFYGIRTLWMTSKTTEAATGGVL